MAQSEVLVVMLFAESRLICVTLPPAVACVHVDGVGVQGAEDSFAVHEGRLKGCPARSCNFAVPDRVLRVRCACVARASHT